MSPQKQKTSKGQIFCDHAGHSPFALRRVYVDTDREFVALLDREGKEVWVNTCGKPSVLAYNLYIKQCAHCWAWFSSPVEDICVPCFKVEPSHEGPYRGWRWVFKQCLAYDEWIRNL